MPRSDSLSQRSFPERRKTCSSCQVTVRDLWINRLWRSGLQLPQARQVPEQIGSVLRRQFSTRTSDVITARRGHVDPPLTTPTRPPRGACVAVTPNLVWIAQVGDCVQVLYDRGRSCARGGGRGDGSRHATKGTRAPPGRLRVRFGPRSRDRRGDRVIACEAMKRRSAARIGVNSRDPDPRGDVGDNRLLITDPTEGLLSRGSQVRILPGAPFSRRILPTAQAGDHSCGHFSSFRPVTSHRRLAC